MSSEPEARPAATPAADKYPRVSPWVGWIAFAAVGMVVLGSFHILQGLLAFVDPDYFVGGEAGPVVKLDFGEWGWVHVVAGSIMLVAGLCIFGGQVWARAVGVLIAFASAIVNFGFLGAYPVWSLMMIALDLVIILALTMHGSDIKP